MAQKIPPPPMLIGPEWQAFNRWLLDLTSILNDDGSIDPGSVPGLDTLNAEVEALQATVAVQSIEINSLNNTVSSQAGQISSLLGSVVSLEARSQVFTGTGAPSGTLGNITDWYANVGGGAGARIYIKTAATTWTPFPF